MSNYFGFIDETGVLHNDPDQRFFAIGLLKCDDTSALYEEFRMLKNRAESKLDLERQTKGLPVKKGCFEFKFSSITRGSHEFYYDLINLYFKFTKLQFCSLVIDKTNPGVKIEEVFPDTWEAYIGYSKMLIKNNMKPDDEICVVADFWVNQKQALSIMSQKLDRCLLFIMPLYWSRTPLFLSSW